MSKPFSIVVVGDFAPLRPLRTDDPAVAPVWRCLQEADLTLANLEMPLTDALERADKAITLKASPQVAPSLKAVGLDQVSLANNHACDFGPAGLRETRQALTAAGIAAVGAGEDIGQAYAAQVMEHAGLRVAHIGICCTLPPGFAAAENRPGVAPLRARSRFYIDSVTLDEQPGIAPWVETSLVAADLDYACAQVRAAKAQADYLIVQIHWGIPHGWCALFQGPLADYQRPLAQALAEAGADLILGHHPHTVHGLEWLDGCLVAYSLGNFLFHSMAEGHETKLTTKYPPYNVDSLETGEAREAVILQARLAEGKLMQVRLRPVALNPQGEPVFLSGERARGVLERLQRHSAKLGTQVTINGVYADLRPNT